MVKDQEIVARRGRENERKERSDIIVLQLILINKKKNWQVYSYICITEYTGPGFLHVL